MSRHSIRGRRWQELAEVVKDRDGRACIDCGSGEDLTIDHIIPVADLIAWDMADEAWNIDNLVTRCRPCNSSKGAGLEARPQVVSPLFAEVLNLPPMWHVDDVAVFSTENDETPRASLHFHAQG